ncbi:MAG: carboxypeptidase regulatory-like domain-containing protein [Polyangiaceae bacterium]
MSDGAEGSGRSNLPLGLSAEETGMARAVRRLTVWLAACVCLLFVASFRDLGPSRSNAPPSVKVQGQRSPLSVRARRADGKPLPDVQVVVYATVDDRSVLVGRGRTDALGALALKAVPRGELWVLAWGEGLARVSRRLVLQDAPGSVELSLRPAEVLEVVVVDPDQHPVMAAQVRVWGHDALSFQGKTDARGLAAFGSLGGGPYRVEARAPGFDLTVVSSALAEQSPLFVKLDRLAGLDLRVLFADGRPAPGATVLVAGSSLWPARSRQSDETGRVSMRGLPRGFYEVRATKDLLVSESSLGVLLERGESKEMTLTLLPGRMVKVLVRAGAGPEAQPIAGADVALVEYGLSSFPLYGRSGASGEVSLGPIRGDATVSARADGYVAQSAVVVDGSDEEVRVNLIKGGRVAGRVVDESGFPVEGASLEVVGVDTQGMVIAESSRLQGFRDDHFSFALPGARPLIPMGQLGVMPIVPDVPLGGGATVVQRRLRTKAPWVSNAKGHFRLEPVTPGRVRVIARHPQLLAAVTEVFELAEAGNAEVELTMRRGGILEGRVLEADGHSVAGARIDLLSEDGLVDRTSLTADDGGFAFSALPQSVTLTVSRRQSPDRIAVRMGVDVKVGERRALDIVLPALREATSFRVTDAQGFPLDRVQLSLSSLDPKTPAQWTLFSDSKGEVVAHEVRGLPLRVVASRSKRAPSVLELPSAPAEVEIALRPALTITGRVVSRNGIIAGARIRVLTATGTRLARTASNGIFVVDDLAPGMPGLLVVAPSYVSYERTLEIVEDRSSPVDLGDIELALGGAVSGRVTDTQGEPIVGARVAAGRVPSYLPVGPLPLGVTFTDSRGRFVLKDIAPGETSVEAFKPGLGRDHLAKVDVRPGGTVQDVQIVMHRDPAATHAPWRGAGSLAVTLGELTAKDLTLVRFEHVPFGGEAERAGIRAGDRLLAIGGVPIKRIEQARKMLSGPLPEQLVLTLGRVPNLRWRMRVRRERVRR